MTGFLNSYLLITKVSHYLKENGKAWDNDVYFENQLNDYFDLLRTLLKRRDIDIISKALILEVHELRASDWHFDEKISMFYEEKLKELTRIQFKDAKLSLEQNKPFNDSSSSVPMENGFVNGEYMNSNSMENCKISSSESAKCNGDCNSKGIQFNINYANLKMIFYIF